MNLLEHPVKDEHLLIQNMETILKEKMGKDYTSGYTKRDAHPKHLALLKAEFIVEENLPEELKVGIFKNSKNYKCFIRCSSASPKPQSDAKKDIRGFAIKLVGVEGERGQNEEKQTQDFLLISMPTMPLGTVKLFHDAIYYSIKVSPLVLLAKFVFSGKLSILKALNKGKQNHTSPLDVRYWSTTPYQFGPTAAKYSVVPTSSYKSAFPEKLTEHYLTENIAAHLQKEEATFDFKVQLFKDQSITPIEDAAKEWMEAETPFVKVATIRIPKQTVTTPERTELAENFSLSPAHSLLDHQPIGGINRARILIYKGLSKFRHGRNDKRQVEPTKETYDKLR